MKIAIMGYGTIGSGVAEVLKVNKELITERAGQPVEIKYILDLRDFPGDENEDKIIKDYQVIVQDPEVEIVVEAMGGVEPAYTFVKEMLLAGKQVATSNKNLVAEKGAELIALAREKGINFMFGASVGGGIPIIRPLNTCLTADEIDEITGILNGTTNYMLTRMADEGIDFAEVLKEAQAKGYAEADPTADVEGIDPCRKIAILMSLVCGRQVDYQDIYTEGITRITTEDFAYAKKMGCSIKLLASGRRCGDKCTCMVAPFLLPKTHPLATVNDVFNGVFLHGNMLGDAMFYGSGAGKLPTASAVAADVVDMIRHRSGNVYIEWKPEKMQLTQHEESQSAFFVRTTSNREKVESVFGQVFYIDAEPIAEISECETAFVTAKMTEKDFEDKAARIDLIGRIRVAGEIQVL